MFKNLLEPAVALVRLLRVQVVDALHKLDDFGVHVQHGITPASTVRLARTLGVAASNGGGAARI